MTTPQEQSSYEGISERIQGGNEANLKNLIQQINELKDKDQGGANDAIEDVFDANGALDGALETSLKDFSLEDLNTIKGELSNILQDDSLGLSDEVKDSVNKLIGIFDRIISEKTTSDQDEHAEKSEADKELDEVFVDNKVSTLQSIYKTYATAEGKDWNGENITAVPQSVFERNGAGKKFNAEQFRDRFNTENGKRIDEAKTKGEEIIKSVDISGITYDSGTGKFKKGDADFDVKDLLLDGDGVKGGLADFVINKDELSKDWFSDTVRHWENTLKGRFETSTEGSGEWDEVGDVEAGLVDKLGGLGENKFLEKQGEKIVYNLEKVKSFLGMINKDNFKNYWSLERNGNGYTVVGKPEWKAINSAVQILLNKLGGKKLKVDGKWIRGRAMWKAIQEFQREKKLSNTNGQLDLQTMQALSGVETTVEDNQDATADNSDATPASSGSSSGTSTEIKPVTPSSKKKPATTETPATTPKPKFRSPERYKANDPEHATDYGLKWSEVTNDSTEKQKWGIPPYVKVYTKGDNQNELYYKDSDKNCFWSVLKTKPYIMNKNDIKGGKLVLDSYNSNPCAKGREELQKQLNVALTYGGLSTSGKKIETQGLFYCVKSFGYSQNIDISVLTGTGKFYKNNLGGELRLLNLANYLKSSYSGIIKERGGKFKIRNGYDLVITGMRGYIGDHDVIDDDTFKRCYGQLNEAQSVKYCDYLNSIIS